MAKKVVGRKIVAEKAENKIETSQSPQKKNSNKINLTDKSYTPILLVLLLVAAFLLGALSTKLSYVEKGQGQTGQTQTGIQGTVPNQAPSPGVRVKVDNGHLPVLGKNDAKVTIIEFADFQCPFCERFFKDTIPNLKKDYVDTGKVKLAFRHYAFLGQESTWAAQASECANEQDKFWEYHDYLYNNQGPENSGAFAKDKLIGFAESLGLNKDQFASCLNSDKYSKNVSDDLSAGQKAGVTGTPATFINGQLIVGAQPYASFKTLIDEELKKIK
ncbi:MAG: DsbA family protein [Candidatus Levybacteria bacterium]|nr:DsbA family protein [Candidatus Levybacteria bacterium]